MAARAPDPQTVLGASLAPEAASSAAGSSTNADALVALAVVWLASAAQVAGALASGQPFGIASTLALAVVLLVPLAAWPRPRDARRAGQIQSARRSR